MDAATEAQIIAASPDRSTWLSANAGSGKTRVLTNRVARLLLRGTLPQNILCLTYTKAAASEMQNRLFKTLGRWAMLEDRALRAELTTLGEAPPEDLSRARTLFARAIDAPGGLKIQTIHSLCSSILRQFPLEGGVSPQFRELDEAGQTRLIEEVLETLADHPSLAKLSAVLPDDGYVSLAKQVAGRSDEFLGPSDRAAAFRKFGVPTGETLDSLLERAISRDDLAFLRGLAIPLRREGSTNDIKAAAVFEQLPETSSRYALDLLVGLVLLKKPPFSAKIGDFPTKGMRESASMIAQMPRLETIMRRVETARLDLINLDAAETTAALQDFAEAFLPAYTAVKQTRAALDFDDLILRTRDVLNSPALPWVLYRLDGNIDHVLVDEAQDTSPAQWQVIQAIARELGSDETRPRTLFVVGDKKQSIYSFQGADAAGFDSKEGEFREVLAQGIEGRDLLHSFRSSPAILSVVDAVFSDPGLAGLSAPANHSPYFPGMPGRVDLYPLIEEPEAPDEPEWFEPVDRPVDNAASVRLGEGIAELIENLLENETIAGENGPRRVMPGDIMILVQRRKEVFDQILSACKKKKLEIAGADLLRIDTELAVRDLVALLSFLALPEDSLSLAAALRSPIFGWSEQELYSLAQGRGKDAYLWQELRRRKDEFSQTYQTLSALLDKVDFLRPFEFLETILGEFGARQRLLERLGSEAGDGIDELLNRALTHERDAVPSLTGFLSEFDAETIEIKRQADGSEDLIRMLTVHGAKGLERPIVILPDTTAGEANRSGQILSDDEGTAIVMPKLEAAHDRVLLARERQHVAEAEERGRLLYVAMTRAESWLIVWGKRPKTNKVQFNWHETVAEGMRLVGAEEIDGKPGSLRVAHGAWPENVSVAADSVTEQAAVPAIPDTPFAPVRSVETRLNPSDLGGAKVGAGEHRDESGNKRRGRLIHLLFEHLPGADDPMQVAQILLVQSPDKAKREEIPELVNETLRNLSLFPDIFGKGSLAEVPIASAQLPSLGGKISGAIDRLIVTAERVVAVDFKTNAIVPDRPEDTPEGLLRQMGAYLEALEQVYPDRSVDVAILWTSACKLMPLPHAIVREALRNSTIS